MEVKKVWIYVCLLQGAFMVHVSSAESSKTESDERDDISRVLNAAFRTGTGSQLSAPSASNSTRNAVPRDTLSSILGGGFLDLTTYTQLMVTLAVFNTTEKKCSQDAATYISDVLQAKLWTYRMYDATGKPGRGLLQGGTKFWGMFDECLKVVSEDAAASHEQVRGDTCVATLAIPSQVVPPGMEHPQATDYVVFEWHVCLPASCPGSTVKIALQISLAGTNITTVRVVSHEEIKSGPIGNDPAAVGAVVLVAVLGFLVLLGTSVDLGIRARSTIGRTEKPAISQSLNATTLHTVCTKSNAHGATNQAFTGGEGAETTSMDTSSTNGQVKLTDKNNGVVLKSVTSDDTITEKRDELKNERDVENLETLKQKVQPAPLWQKLLLCFSAVSNGEKILSVKNTPGSLTCLNGVRVLSMGWVILGHTFLMLSGIAENPSGLSDLMKTFSFQIVLNASLAVDSFFLLSGLLVTYLFLRETEKKGGVTVKQMALYYVHRFWRLTPTYAMAIFLYTCVVPYMVHGPVWDGPIDRQNCEDNWWTNILYINNLYREKHQCLSWGWYLSNDMQFYVVAPLALIPLALGKSDGIMLRLIGLCVIAAFLITSIVFSGFYGHKYNANLFHNSQDYTLYVYQKPWCRVGTFAIGMGLGYILHATKSKIRTPVAVVWILALAAAGACTLSTYDENGHNRSPWEVEARASHDTLSRPVWGLVLAWVILMCCTGKAGIVNWMLSWAWWQPLARLTYGAFLLHPIIIHMDVRTARTLAFYTADYVVNRFLGYTCLSYMMSFLLAILVEAPLLQLEKILLS